MCGSSKAPKPPPRAPEAPRLPDQVETGGGTDADKRRRAAAAGEGANSTILTSARGVQNGAATAGKTLLGQ